ncbi:MAG: hypothetical protein IKO99_12565 [Bacteroidales bacterium]|nr:hypothetical protein [Bacteroidales bacterium]MBR4678825.1 hypothetical protein [Bacteroidales bacterium]
MSTLNYAKFIGQGAYAVNVDNLEISDSSRENLFIYRYLAGAQFNSSGKLQNNVLCGFVALTEGDDGDMKLAPNAVLINKGVITLKMKDLYDKSVNDKSVKVDALRAYAMAAGENSVLINEGVINICMDYDKDSETTMYCCAMWAEANSMLINRGEIHFYGNGSYQSLIRGVGGVANNLHVVNEGVITADVERAFQTRILHSAGHGGSLINKGKIKLKVSGRIMTIGSVTGTTMINEGEIEAVSLATLINGKIPYLFNFPPMATGMYEHFRPGKMLPAPVVNKGSIKIHLVGSEKSGSEAIAFGFYYQMENKDENNETPVRYVSNEGTVEVTQEGPQKYITAELGVNMQLGFDNPVKMKVLKWNRGKSDHVLACRSAEFDISSAALTENDVFQTSDAKLKNLTCKIK